MLGCAVLLLMGAGRAANAEDGVSIAGVWCLPSTGRPHTAYVYMTITVTGRHADSLVAADSSLSPVTDILAPTPDGLRPSRSLELAAHTPTILEPHAAHLILRALTRQLKPGETVPVTLRFALAGERTILAPVVDSPPGTGMPSLPPGVKLAP